jgi:hypothetical protein
LKTAGVYLFELEVVDNRASWKFDTMKVTVNASPIASAGPDATITLPTNIYRLNGSLSKDPDGTISKYQWSRVSGPNTPVFVSATSSITDVKGLIQGIYRFRLTVTDNRNAVSSDDMYLTVNASAGVANPGIVEEKTSGIRLFYDAGSKMLIISGDWERMQQGNLKVYDINGREVERQVIRSNRIMLTTVRKGIYVVELMKGKERLREKVRVE